MGQLFLCNHKPARLASGLICLVDYAKLSVDGKIVG